MKSAARQTAVIALSSFLNKFGLWRLLFGFADTVLMTLCPFTMPAM